MTPKRLVKLQDIRLADMIDPDVVIDWTPEQIKHVALLLASSRPLEAPPLPKASNGPFERVRKG